MWRKVFGVLWGIMTDMSSWFAINTVGRRHCHQLRLVNVWYTYRLRTNCEVVLSACGACWETRSWLLFCHCKRHWKLVRGSWNRLSRSTSDRGTASALQVWLSSAVIATVYPWLSEMDSEGKLCNWYPLSALRIMKSIIQVQCEKFQHIEQVQPALKRKSFAIASMSGSVAQWSIFHL